MSEILVLKLGGTTLADQQQVLAEVAAVARRRPVVVVHGGGKRMTEWLDRLGVPTRFEGGLRVTDAQALEVAAAVLRGVVNSELVAALRAKPQSMTFASTGTGSAMLARIQTSTSAPDMPGTSQSGSAPFSTQARNSPATCPKWSS